MAKQRDLTKINTRLFLFLYAAIFVLIAIKVFVVPITHDEVPTTTYYRHFSVWEIMMYPDYWPNNHILNTICVKFTTYLFGTDPWAVRLPNLLSFLLLGAGVFRLLKTVLTKQSYFFIPFAILFVANPYFLDFFGLSRGYGMSLALLVLSVSYLIEGFKEMRTKSIWIALVVCMLASYAHFTLLVFWIAVSFMVFIYFLLKYREQLKSAILPIFIFLLLCFGYSVLIAMPIYKMHLGNEFIFWTKNGFVQETLLPLIDLSTNSSGMEYLLKFFAFSGILLILFNALYLFIQLLKNSVSDLLFRSPLFVGTTVLFATVGVNLMQSWVLGTPNLTGRTALFFFPLFVIAIVVSLVHFKKINSIRVKIWSSVLIVSICLLQLIQGSSIESVQEWEYDKNTVKVLDFVITDSHLVNSTIATNWMFNPSFNFYITTQEMSWLNLLPFDDQIRPETEADYYYVYEQDYEVLKSKFIPVAKFDDCWLLKKI